MRYRQDVFDFRNSANLQRLHSSYYGLGRFNSIGTGRPWRFQNLVNAKGIDQTLRRLTRTGIKSVRLTAGRNTNSARLNRSDRTHSSPVASYIAILGE